jgi:hypothetical protein
VLGHLESADVFAVSELGKGGLWIRASGSSLHAIGPHDQSAEPALRAIEARGARVRVALWELYKYDAELADSKTDEESRAAFAESNPDYVRCAIVPDIYDEELLGPAVEVIAGGLDNVDVRVFERRADALDWLREVETTVPQGVPAWRTSRPPPAP